MDTKKILIVHNSQKAKEEIHHIISKFNFEVVYVNNGKEGLDVAKNWQPDLIIARVNMPELSGIDMTKEIRSNNNLNKTEIIFLHEELDLRMLSLARKLDIKAFLIKPYINNSLIYAIKSGLGCDLLMKDEKKIPVAYESCQRLSYA